MRDLSLNASSTHSFEQFMLQPKRLFYVLCFVHLILWTLAPALWQKNGALDVLEAIAWGGQWQFGYDRDPFLIAWISQIASWFSGHSLWSIYFVSQLCILTSFWAMWRLAREVQLSPIHAFMSVLFLEGIFYYHFTTPEFNDNVLQIPFWALTARYFYSALCHQRIKDWALTGLFVALAMLSKYFAVMLVVPMALLVLLTIEGRASFRQPGIYLGAVISLLVFLPNLLWQIEHHWQYIHYALDRSDVSASIWNHVKEPAVFFFAQLLAVSPALVLLIWAGRAMIRPIKGQRFAQRYLMTMALGPLLTVVVYALITGTHIRSMWGTPLFSVLGVFMVFITRPDPARLPRVLGSFVTYFFMAWIGYVVLVTASPYIYGYAKNEFYPSQQVANEVTQLWRQYQPGPIPYVLGTRRLTSRVSVYSPDHPTPYFDLNSATSPWIQEQDIRLKGGMVIWEVSEWGGDVPAHIRQRFETVQKLTELVLPWQTQAPGISPITVGIAILPPKS